MNLKAKDLVREGSQVFYTYRGKGGKTGKRELAMPDLSLDERKRRAKASVWSQKAIPRNEQSCTPRLSSAPLTRLSESTRTSRERSAQ